MKSRARIPGLLLAVALLASLQLHPALAAGPSPLFDTAGIAAIAFAGQATEAATRSAVATANNDGQAADLFGMDTEPVGDGEVLKKWNRARAGIAEDRNIVDRCRADSECPAVAQKLIGLSEEGAGREGRAKVGLINRAVDLAISPASDESQWRVTDHWSAPLETLRSGRGDCEDYAIVKYAALATAGIPESDMKIVILTNAFPNEDHAVLAVRVDGEWLLLDNRRLALVRDTELMQATPKLVLDQAGARRFVSRGRPGRVG
jgi:predicted transglutaminase-like cysteine proteinase